MVLLKARMIPLMLLFAVMTLGVDWIDPPGDQVGTWPVFDLLEYSASFAPGSLEVTLRIDPAEVPDIDFLAAYIDLDTDQDPLTGWVSHPEALGLEPYVPLGMEYYLELITGEGYVILWRTTGESEESVGLYPVEVNGATVTMSLPRCHTTGCDGIEMGARFNSVVVIMGDGVTDRAPDDDSVISAEPGQGDLDEDGDVDGDDATMLQSCMTGSQGGPVTGACGTADLDSDQDVDQTDFGLLQRLMTGPF